MWESATLAMGVTSAVVGVGGGGASLILYSLHIYQPQLDFTSAKLSEQEQLMKISATGSLSKVADV